MKVLLSSIYPYAFILLFLIIPFDEYVRALPNILVGILVIAFPFIVSKSDFKKLKKLPTYLVLAFFGYLLLNALVTGRFDENFTVIKKVLISVGLLLLYLPVSDFKKLNKAIIFSSLAAILFSLIKIVATANEIGILSYGDSQNEIETLIMDRLYMGLLCVFSILISYQSIKKEYHANNNYNLANIVINALFIFLVVSRIAIVILLVLIVVRQFYGGRKALRVFIALGAVTVLMLMATLLNANIKNRFLYNTPENAQQTLAERAEEGEPRAVVWNCACELIQNEGLLLGGLGFSGAKDKLVDCYSNKISDLERKEFFIQKRFNSHNQFIDFYLSTGIIAVLLFTAIFVVVFIRERRSFYPIAILISMFLFANIENFFHRQVGAYYFGFVLITLLIANNNLFPKQKEEEV